MEIIRIGDLCRWTQVEKGKSMNFDANHKPRKIRLDLRASAALGWSVEYSTPDGEVRREFLTVTPEGLSALEVNSAYGGIRLFADLQDGDSLLIQTPELEKFDLVGLNPGESFLTLAHRRERNPEVEMMEFLMNQNMLAREAALHEEMERRFAAMTAERKEPNGDETGVHERPAPKREKLPKDPAGRVKTGPDGRPLQPRERGLDRAAAGEEGEDGDEPAGGEDE